MEETAGKPISIIHIFFSTTYSLCHIVYYKLHLINLEGTVQFTLLKFISSNNSFILYYIVHCTVYLY